MKTVFRLVFTLLIFACSKEKEVKIDVADKFTKDLKELKDYFQVPGLAVSIQKDEKIVYQKYLGYSDLESKTKLDSTVLFPVASLTKIFSSVLLMKLMEEEKLSLDDPVKKYMPDVALNDSILIKHILSHTSQGEIGKNFYYSYRFGALTRVISEASKKPFDEYMNEVIFDPLGLKNTYLLKNASQVTQNDLRIATPYLLEDSISLGNIDYGFSASAGIVSNINDLHIFNKALDNNTLISEKSKKVMFSGLDQRLPYSYGIFNQKFQGEDLIWGYGQYDCYSSLLLKIPSKKLTLTILANNNLISDPARLIYGDVLSSLFALSFLKNYIYSEKEMILFENEASLQDSNRVSNPELYRKKLLAQALASSFMARFDIQHIKTSEKLLTKVFFEFPDYLAYADLNLLHTLTFLKDVTFYKELEEFNQFDKKIETISTKLLEEDPENPYVNVYMGIYHNRKGNKEKAFYHFKRIVEADNFSKFWYTAEAKKWIKQHKPEFNADP
ncbi:beta-lactamase family protein [Aquimarina sp. U1-2]|uniref:serine hydrolase domain-containing protein n=1 Tax=Aquimarina sp. U1-2 TaxID=2823141 RepID=UPI001AED09EE|nr:serine hydrolase domain-containing protein [Aquimarina sp. U1-2]MBP2834116.1 beta-lactamase family protein [Aquimarina sp. U1-2]